MITGRVIDATEYDSLTKITIMIGRKIKGEWQNDFFNIITFDKYKFEKDDIIDVYGRLIQNKWQVEGENQSQVEIIADMIKQVGHYKRKEQSRGIYVEDEDGNVEELDTQW